MNYSAMSEEDIARLTAIEKKQPIWQQLQALTDIADITQELLNVADSAKKESAEQIKALGAVLTDAREQLVELNKKEAPEAPDYAKPVVDAVGKIESAISRLDLKPKITLPAPVVDVKAPEVNVSAPDVTVDLKPLEKLLKNDIPKAFKDAISSIPATEMPETTDRWDEVLAWLESIDTASRMVPQQPDTIKVVNPDGSEIGSTPVLESLLTELYVENGAMAKRVLQSGSVYYMGWAAPGTATNTNAWRISRVDTSGSPEIAVTTFADGNREFDNNWDDVLILSYS